MSKWLICVYVIYTYMLRGMWIIGKKTTKILQGAIWVQYRVDITVFCLRLACYVEIQVPWVSFGVSLLQRMKSVCLAGLQMDWKWFWGDQYRLAVAVARRMGSRVFACSPNAGRHLPAGPCRGSPAFHFSLRHFSATLLCLSNIRLFVSLQKKTKLC